MAINPFNSKLFATIWLQHFGNNRAHFNLAGFANISFVKHKQLPLYNNIGDNLTNGFEYVFDENAFNSIGHNTILVKDVPSYYATKFTSNNKLRCLSSYQYQGYVTPIKDYESIDAYMKSQFKSNARSKFRRNIKRLEQCFSVVYKMYYGAIDKDTFNTIFDTFYKLFEKRYKNKNESCGELDPKLWNYYTQLAYDLIQEKLASLFVIYADNRPIGVAFNYHYGTQLIQGLTVFDIDYSRFNIGHITIQKMLTWSFENGITNFDYTQGDFQYKKRWSSATYNTEFKVFYNPKSIVSSVFARVLKFKFDVKRIIRDRKWNDKYHKFKHQLSANSKADKQFEILPFQVDVLSHADYDKTVYKSIDLYDDNLLSQRKALFDYLYMHPETVNTLKAYYNSSDKSVIVESLNTILKITQRC